MTRPRILIVTKFPAQGRGLRELKDYLVEAEINPAQVIKWSSAVPAEYADHEPTKTDLRSYRYYIQDQIIESQPSHILALGGEALFVVTGRAGIMKYRGRIEQVYGAQAFCTISPSMVSRNPGHREGLLADLRYFHTLLSGVDIRANPHHLPGERQTTVDTKDTLKAMLRAVGGSDTYAYDIETTGASEHGTGAAIVSLAITTAGPDGMASAHVWKLPLFHPQSPWRKSWLSVLQVLGKVMMQAPRRVAQNAKYDTRWLHQFGVPDLSPTFDTIIAAALLDENRPKGLKDLARQLLGADSWAVNTKNLLDMPLDEVLEYNGLDTWHTLRLYYLFRDQLKAQPRLGRLFVYLMMPAVQELVGIERRGVHVDTEVLATNHTIAKQHLSDIEAQLMEYVPHPDEWPPNLSEINFNASNFARWWLFEYLQLPVLARGKTKDDGSQGAPSMAEAVMLELAEVHPVGKLMGERALWFKRLTGFFEPYSNQLDNANRIHTTFKPWGTVTGRLSSGKEDVEKITSKGEVRRGVNLQQVPRDVLLRGVFGAPPGCSFVEADYSQIELRIAAFLARDEAMLHLYATGQDIHLAMAMRMTGKPASAITKEERKRAKAVNFGFLYGMGWRKFIQTAWLNYQVRVTEEESQAFRKSFFDQFKQLSKWHNHQRYMARKFKRVETPMGRIRHLPDIDSPNDDVRAEAERQAINSPVQGMASDMALLSLVHIQREFRKQGMKAHVIGAVHDAVNFEIPDDEVAKALPLIKDTMEHLPLARLFGRVLDVPIVADLKVGTHWGGARELSADEVYNWRRV